MVDEEEEFEFLKKIVGDNLDEKDIKIYQKMKNDGRITDTEIAEELDISITTARRRRAKLQENGHIYIITLIFFNHAYADCLVTINPNVSIETLNDFVEESVQDIRIFEVTKYVGRQALLLRFWEKDMESVNQYIHEFLMGREVVKDFEILPAIGSPKSWNRIIEE